MFFTTCNVLRRWKYSSIQWFWAKWTPKSEDSVKQTIAITIKISSVRIFKIKKYLTSIRMINYCKWKNITQYLLNNFIGRLGEGMWSSIIGLTLLVDGSGMSLMLLDICLCYWLRLWDLTLLWWVLFY